MAPPAQSRGTRPGTEAASTSACHRLSIAVCLSSAVIIVAVWLGVTNNQSPPPLLVISVAGLAPDLLDTMSQLPFFSQMRRHGTTAQWLNPSQPGRLATAASVFTGVHPDRHGVLGSHFLDRRHGELQVDGAPGQSDADAIWWDAEPLWCAVERHGGAAVVFNVHGGCAEVNGLRASSCISPGDVTVENELELGLSALVSRLPMSNERSPWLGVAHTNMVSRAAEQSGVISAAVQQALRQLDLQLQRLDRALMEMGRRDEVNILVLSSGGLTDTASIEPVPLDSLMPPQTVFTATGNGAACLVYLEAQHKATVLTSLENSTAVRALSRGSFPPELHVEHPQRGPDILLMARPGFYIENTAPLAAAAVGSYDDTQSDFADMRGVLIARGPSFREGAVVQQVNSVDVFGLMTSVLGVTSQDGNARTEHVAGMMRNECYVCKYIAR